MYIQDILINKPDEDLLQISDDYVQQYGNATLALGRTSSTPSSSQYVNSLYDELQRIYQPVI